MIYLCLFLILVCFPEGQWSTCISLSQSRTRSCSQSRTRSPTWLGSTATRLTNAVTWTQTNDDQTSGR